VRALTTVAYFRGTAIELISTVVARGRARKGLQTVVKRVIKAEIKLWRDGTRLGVARSFVNGHCTFSVTVRVCHRDKQSIIKERK
jgi:hypothetical protein